MPGDRLNHTAGGRQLHGNGLLAEPREIRVTPRVIAKLMPLRHNALGERRQTLHLTTDHKKAGHGVSGPQGVENRRREAIIGTVIEGERHLTRCRTATRDQVTTRRFRHRLTLHVAARIYAHRALTASRLPFHRQHLAFANDHRYAVVQQFAQRIGRTGAPGFRQHPPQRGVLTTHAPKRQPRRARGMGHGDLVPRGGRVEIPHRMRDPLAVAPRGVRVTRAPIKPRSALGHATQRHRLTHTHRGRFPPVAAPVVPVLAQSRQHLVRGDGVQHGIQARRKPRRTRHRPRLGVVRMLVIQHGDGVVEGGPIRGQRISIAFTDRQRRRHHRPKRRDRLA